jgi:Mg-chelatase subunit ChlD
MRSILALSASALLAGMAVGCSSSDSSSNRAGDSNDNNGSGNTFGSNPEIATGTTGAGGDSSSTTGGFGLGSGGTSATGGPVSVPSGAGGSTEGAMSGGNPGVAAGEWDDNADYREFLAYLKQNESLGYSPLDISDRQFIVVVDAAGHAVVDCPLVVSDGTHATSLRTTAAGRTPLFPKAAGLTGDTFTVQATCADGSAQGTLAVQGEDNVLTLKLAVERTPIATKAIDLAFILDTTGSMAEEIDAIKSTVSAVATKLGPQQGLAVRVGMVAYKDYGDPYVTKSFPFTSDFAGFRTSIAGLSASGGGDIPEAVNEALHTAGQLDWNDNAFARVAFLIADAPPHMHEQYDYATEAKSLLSRGIQVFTVSASGQTALGQVVFRQIAQYTYATNMFVLRGGAGPQSVGGGDPKTSCGTTQTAYASGNLDDLITDKVLDQISLYDHDPLDIPGLHADAHITACPDGGADGGAEAAPGGGG